MAYSEHTKADLVEMLEARDEQIVELQDELTAIREEQQKQQILKNAQSLQAKYRRIREEQS